MEIKKEEAKKLYPEVPGWFKEKLKEAFGPELLANWEDIETYEDAVAMRKVDDEDVIYKSDAPYVVALKKLDHIVKTINEGWSPAWGDANQPKWYPVFLSSCSGFVSSYSRAYYVSRDSNAGSRQC